MKVHRLSNEKRLLLTQILILPLVINRLVVLESGLGLESRLKSIFAGLELGQKGFGLGLGKICNQVHFRAHLQCLV